jgi:integrase
VPLRPSQARFSARSAGLARSSASTLPASTRSTLTATTSPPFFRSTREPSAAKAGDRSYDTSSSDAANVRRAFRRITRSAGLDPADWTPRELRHSFVSLLSDSGVSLEDIADLCGHSGTTVTEKVYRHQLRPVLMAGAIAMDRIFASDAERLVTQLDTHE